MVNEQSDFIEQGLLPFVGREEELERIVRFWEGTPNAWGIRGTLLLGEAGVGKSRLLDAVEARIESEGGGLLRLKALPDSSQSIPSLMAESIRYAGWTGRLVGSGVEPTIGSVIPALRRLSRLRPILLIVENLHLLGKEGQREVLRLLDGLAEETISLLVASREPPGAPFERFLTDEIVLAGLDAGGISELMHRLLGLQEKAEWIDRLTEATGGNPLALRGALRRLLSPAGTGGMKGTVTIDRHALLRIAEEQTTTFAEGMLAHLDPVEREGAERLAGLGEIIPLESARALLPENPQIVDTLMESGVLVRYDRPTPPLPGGASDHPPLVFAHSLVHQMLRERTSTPVDLLVRVLGNDLPLYSLLPLQILCDSPLRIDIPADLALRSIRRINAIARHLNGTTAWERSEGVWDIAWRMFEGLPGSGGRDDTTRDELEAELRETRLWLMNGRLGRLTQMEETTEYRRHLDRLFELTEHPDRRDMLPHRINALRHRHLLLVDSWPESLEPWEEVDRLVADHPSLLASPEHVRFLSFIAGTIARHGDTDQCRRLRARLHDILASPEATEEIRREVHIRVALPLLHAYTTREELEENLRLAEEGLGEFRYGHSGVTVGLASFESARAGLLFISGNMASARTHALHAEGLCVDLGHIAGAFQNRLTAIAADGALGKENGEIMQEGERIGEEYAIAREPRFRRMIGMYLAEIALLSSDWNWVEEIFTTFAPEVPHHYIEADVMTATVGRRLDELLPMIPEDNDTRRRVRPLIEVTLGRRILNEEMEETIREWLGAPILRTADHLRLRMTILLLHHSETEGVNAEAFREEIRDALRRSLDWLRERSLYRYMTGIVETFGDYLTKRDREATRADIRRMAEERESELKRRQGSSAGTHISMVGTITATGPDGEEVQIRGERVRTFLGLLVGAEMLEHPLSREEFRRIATGEFEDPNLARKNTNMAAIRLREAVGTDIVRVGEERHELDRDLVEVDLLSAHGLIDEALEALRDRSLLRAAPAILEALALTRGEVPFPGLYDDFFESLREDFEARLRSTTLEVADALLHERDFVRAEEILRHAWAAMPEDEELAERLEEALVGLDRRAEGLRVRMAMERV